jgi:hypothetical protein
MAQQITLQATAVLPDVQRSQITQDSLVKYPILFNLCRKDDDLTASLPGTPTGRYLGLISGTFGTNSPSLQTEDLKAAGATNKYGRFLFELPPEYDPGNTIQIQFHAGMLTTIADTAATIVVAAYKCDRGAGISANLVVTAALSINSLVLQDSSFTVTPTGCLPGDILDCRVQIVVNDIATGTAVKGIVGAAYFLLNIKG